MFKSIHIISMIDLISVIYQYLFKRRINPYQIAKLKNCVLVVRDFECAINAHVCAHMWESSVRVRVLVVCLLLAKALQI